SYPDHLDVLRTRRKTGEHAHQLRPGLDVRAQRARRRPRGPQLDLRAVAFAAERAEALRDRLRRRAQRGVVACAMRVERSDQPRPRYIRQKRIAADVGFERSLREAHDAPRTVPRRRLLGVVQEHEAARAEDGVAGVGVWADIAGE